MQCAYNRTCRRSTWHTPSTSTKSIAIMTGHGAQLAIARRGLPNDTEAAALEAYMDRRQGRFEKAIQELNEASLRDPHDSVVHCRPSYHADFRPSVSSRPNRRSIGGSNSVRISRYSKLKSQHLPLTLRPGMTPRSARRSLLSQHRWPTIEMPSICDWFSPWLIVIGSKQNNCWIR